MNYFMFNTYECNYTKWLYVIGEYCLHNFVFILYFPIFVGVFFLGFIFIQLIFPSAFDYWAAVASFLSYLKSNVQGLRASKLTMVGLCYD